MLPDRFRTDSVFFTNAEEIRPMAGLKEQTYNFRNARSWLDIGLPFLHSAGWRPDCARIDAANLDRQLPLGMRLTVPIIIGSYDVMERLPTPGEGITKNISLPYLLRPLEVEVVTFYDRPYGYSCSCMRTPWKAVSCQGWIFGVAKEKYNQCLSMNLRYFMGVQIF